MNPIGHPHAEDRSAQRAGAIARDRDLGIALLRLARREIALHLDAPAAEPLAHAALAELGATFVTLLREGELRGCIGSLELRRRLDEDVRDNAVGAAFRDPRFAPLRRYELDALVVEVSLLGPSAPLRFADEADLLAQLDPGRDGLVIAYGGRRATFLPQVWEALPAPRDFLAALKRKAGLLPDFWSPDLSAWRYAVAKWSEDEQLDSEVTR
jgi:AmmeMemoRadiSam system protein A